MPFEGPREIDIKRPSSARMYDWYLGGTHNYAVDRSFATQIMRVCPLARVAAIQNRGFLIRSVRHLAAERGIRQFLDIGSGVPTAENVHEVAQAVDPRNRVVYVDNDNEAIVTAQQMLENTPDATSIYGDIRDVDTVMNNEQVLRHIDFSEPVGLIMMAVLHFVPDSAGPVDLVRRYLDVLPSGSYFAASHVTIDELAPGPRAQFENLEREYGNTRDPATLRDRAAFTSFFQGLELTEPGVTYAADWRGGQLHPTVSPKDWDDARPSLWGAVGYKP